MTFVENTMTFVEPLLKPDDCEAGVTGQGQDRGDENDEGYRSPSRSPSGRGQSCGGRSGHRDGASKAKEDIRILKKAIFLSLTFMFAEILGGILANSLAIMTDAAHLLSDVGGFIVSALSLHLISQGYQRAGTSGALVSVMLTWFMTGGLLIGAVQRTVQPQAIDGKLMFVVATMGLVVNLALMKVLGHNHGSHGCCGCTTRSPAPVTVGVRRLRTQRRRREERTEEASASAEPTVSPPENQVSVWMPPPLPDALLLQPPPCTPLPPPSTPPPLCGPCTPANTEEAKADDGQGSPAHSNYSKDSVDEESLAMRAALLHVIGDMIQSVGVMVASLLIWYQPFDLGVTNTGISKWCYADPICTFLFCLVVMLTTGSTAKQAVRQIVFKS